MADPHRRRRNHVRAAGVGARGLATDPLTPTVALAVAGVAVAVAGLDVLTWAVVGGLAGYSLSGSV